MIIGADHNRIAHPAENAGSVSNRLAAPQLAGRAVEDERASAQLPHGHVKTDPRAGRVFLKDHGEHMPVQRLVCIRLAARPPHTRSLARHRVIDHRCNRVCACIAEIKQMARRARGHHAASGTSKSAQPAESLSKNSSISASPITSGGIIRKV